MQKKIYNENKLQFTNLENVRTAIRYLKGTSGKVGLKNLTTDKYLTKEKREEKYNLPHSIMQEYESFKIISEKCLIFSDLHIPFQDNFAIESMFDFTINKNIDTIIIDGDLMDCFSISSFFKEPDLIRLTEERDLTKQFLIELKRVFPKTKIYYKAGNHEARLENYFKIKAPELWGFKEFELKVLLDLFNLGIEYIPPEIFINLDSLSILHGTEYVKAVTSPANPARTIFLRSKDICLVAHYHQSREHNETTINSKVITCWSIGCLSELHPKYMPLNKFNHGFAIYTKDDEEFWHIENKRIIQGRVV